MDPSLGLLHSRLYLSPFFLYSSYRIRVPEQGINVSHKSQWLSTIEALEETPLRKVHIRRQALWSTKALTSVKRI